MEQHSKDVDQCGGDSSGGWARFTDVELTDLRVGDIVEDSYANPAVVVKIRPTPEGRQPNAYQVTIMQLVGSDKGRFGGLPMHIRRMTDPVEADRIRESARETFRHRDDWKRNLRRR